MDAGKECGQPKTGVEESTEEVTDTSHSDTVSLPPTFGRIWPLKSEFLQTSKCFISESNNSGSSLLLEGPVNSHRTSLLFQAAVSFTIEGAAVCYVCPNSFTSLPPGVHGMNQPNPSSAQRLKMMYMQRTEELVSYLAGLHQLPAPPEVLIIDDLHTYVTQSEDAGLERSAARLCAHLVDALNTMELRSACKDVHLLVGTDPVSSSVSDIWPQFFPAAYCLKELPDPGCVRIVPVSSTRRQVAARGGRRPLVGLDYTTSHGRLRLLSVHSTHTGTDR